MSEEVEISRRITEEEADILQQVYLLEGRILPKEELLQEIRLDEFCKELGIDKPSSGEWD